MKAKRGKSVKSVAKTGNATKDKAVAETAPAKAEQPVAKSGTTEVKSGTTDVKSDTKTVAAK